MHSLVRLVQAEKCSKSCKIALKCKGLCTNLGSRLILSRRRILPRVNSEQLARTVQSRSLQIIYILHRGWNCTTETMDFEKTVIYGFDIEFPLPSPHSHVMASCKEKVFVVESSPCDEHRKQYFVTLIFNCLCGC